MNYLKVTVVLRIIIASSVIMPVLGQLIIYHILYNNLYTVFSLSFKYQTAAETLNKTI